MSTVNWISIEERLPEPEITVWKFNMRYKGDPENAVGLGHVDEYGDWWWDWFPINVTHWAEIIKPEPPEKQ